MLCCFGYIDFSRPYSVEMIDFFKAPPLAVVFSMLAMIVMVKALRVRRRSI